MYCRVLLVQRHTEQKHCNNVYHVDIRYIQRDSDSVRPGCLARLFNVSARQSFETDEYKKTKMSSYFVCALHSQATPVKLMHITSDGFKSFVAEECASDVSLKPVRPRQRVQFIYLSIVNGIYIYYVRYIVQ